VYAKAFILDNYDLVARCNAYNIATDVGEVQRVTIGRGATLNTMHAESLT